MYRVGTILVSLLLLLAAAPVTAQDDAGGTGANGEDGGSSNGATAGGSTRPAPDDGEPAAGDEAANHGGGGGDDASADSWCHRNPRECRQMMEKCPDAKTEQERQRCKTFAQHCRDGETSRDREACAKAYCESYPRSERCRTPTDRPDNSAAGDSKDNGTEGNGTTGHHGNGTGMSPSDQPRYRNDAHRCVATGEARSGVCGRVGDHRDAKQDFAWLAYQVGADGLSLHKISVKEHLILDALTIVPHVEKYGPPRVDNDERNHRILLRFEGGSALLRDQSRGFLEYRGAASHLELDLPTGVRAVPHESGLSAHYGPLGTVVFVGNNLTADNGTITAGGFLALHVKPPTPAAKPGGATPTPSASQPAMDRAIGRDQVGAHITIRDVLRTVVQTGDGPGASGAGSDASSASDRSQIAAATGGDPLADGGAVDIIVYDDVNVTVDVPDDTPDTDDPVRVTVSAHLDSGRTIVLDLDEAMFGGPDLELRYFDVHDDGTETEVVFRMADDLQDILDPDDDGGQPEYWIVRDANGLQLMASVPHWSTHAITIASIGAFYVEHSVTIGLVAGGAASIAAAVGLFTPRGRKQD